MRVVLAQALEVADFETVRLEHRDQCADFMKLAVGKDVAFDEGTAVLGGSACTQGDLELTD